MIKGYPIEVRATWIARASWCHYDSKLKATNSLLRTIPQASDTTSRGSEIHSLLETKIHRNPSTKRFVTIIKALEPLYSEILGVRVYAHPDNYFVRPGTKTVRIVEYKTSLQKPTSFQVFPASLQLRTYHLVLQPIVEKIGYELDDTHLLIFFNRPKSIKQLRALQSFFIESNLKATLDEIQFIFDMWAGKANPIPPMQWKCNICIPVKRMFCPWFQSQKRGEEHE